MKKYIIPALCAILALALLLGVGPAIAKYITQLFERDGTVEAKDYYFRSNVMQDSADPSPVTVNGTRASFTLANGTDPEVYANTKITYDLLYYVYADGEWVLADSETDCVFYGGTYRYRTVEFGPITYDGTVCNDILVRAVSKTPYKKTLTLRVMFDYEPYAVEYTYDAEIGVITLTVATNGQAGNYRFTWQKGILPDQSDPNLILTGTAPGAEGGSSKDGSLSANTVYKFVFFVTDADAFAELEADPTLAANYVACEIAAD